LNGSKWPKIFFVQEAAGLDVELIILHKPKFISIIDKLRRFINARDNKPGD
jgi:hypothetical protein|tara:strand:- start:194 stop:346 length:153 start_codon:yes stop_codon:yes gene_type:complete